MFSRGPMSLGPQKYAPSPWSLGRKQSGKEGQGGFAVHDVLSARCVAIAHLFCRQVCLGALAGPDPRPPPAQEMWYRCASRLPTCWRAPPSVGSPACNLHWAALPPTSLLRFKPFDETALWA